MMRNDGNFQYVLHNNKGRKRFKNDYGDVLPFQVGFFAVSRKGKGLSIEGFAERWREETNGIVIYLADPKNEAEGVFCQYEPTKQYHVDIMKKDGAMPRKYSCKTYHPFTFNIPKGFLPEIVPYTISIKDLTREDWSILAESEKTSESTKLLLRVAEDLGHNDGLFSFLHQIQKLTQGKKDKKKSKPDPNNFHLSVGGGTAKSVTEVANLLASFKKNYFLRKDSCEYKLNWKSILADNKNYHVFLSMWLKDDKIKHFCVLNLWNQLIQNIHHAKKPVLLIIPEVNSLCPRNPQGYKMFTAMAMADHLRTQGSKGKSVSTALDGQSWADMDDRVKGSLPDSFLGQLSPKDQEVVCKSMSYQRSTKMNLLNMNYSTFLHIGRERDGAFRILPPRHMHREPGYNWIDMCKKHNPDSMKRYDDLIKQMRSEYDLENDATKDKVKKILDKEELEEDAKREERQSRKDQKEKPKQEKKKVAEDKDKLGKIRLCYDIYNDDSLSKKERGYRAIGRRYDVKLNHVTVKNYIEKYEKKLKEDSKPKDISHMIGSGVLQEEIDEMVTPDMK